MKNSAVVNLLHSRYFFTEMRLEVKFFSLTSGFSLVTIAVQRNAVYTKIEIRLKFGEIGPLSFSN